MQADYSEAYHLHLEIITKTRNWIKNEFLTYWRGQCLMLL